MVGDSIQDVPMVAVWLRILTSEIVLRELVMPRWSNSEGELL